MQNLEWQKGKFTISTERETSSDTFADLQKASASLQTLSARLQRLSASLQHASATLQKPSASLQYPSATLQKASASLQNLTAVCPNYSKSPQSSRFQKKNHSTIEFAEREIIGDNVKYKERRF